MSGAPDALVDFHTGEHGEDARPQAQGAVVAEPRGHAVHEHGGVGEVRPAERVDGDAELAAAARAAAEHVAPRPQRVPQPVRARLRVAPIFSRPLPRGAARGDAARERADPDVAERGARAVERDLGSKRVIQCRFNVSVPRARVPKKASTLRDRSKR